MEKIKQYKQLLNYYKEYFDYINYFHFNSNISRDVFHRYLNPNKERVIPITHRDIKDNRKKKNYSNDSFLKIGFIGSEKAYKGLPILISVLASNFDKKKWQLSVWGGRIGFKTDLPIYYNGKFGKNTIAHVYESMDVLIVPSIWKETFSLVTLEAISYGVPVIVSENVGAKDIVTLYDKDFVYHTREELIKLLQELINNKKKLIDFNSAILTKTWKYDMRNHAIDIVENLYKE